MVRGQRERRAGVAVRPLTPAGPSHVWEPDHLITAVFRDSLGEEKMAETFQQQFCARGVRQLLVLQDLEVYNKKRHSLLLAALRQAASSETCTRDSIRGMVEEQLTGELKALVHYDVIGFWILSLQVRQQVYVLRTETEEDTQRLQRWFSKGRSSSGEAQGENDKEAEEDGSMTTAAGDWKDQGREEEKISADDFATDDQSEERMLQEALSLSLISSMDKGDGVDAAFSPVSVSDSVSHHQQQHEEISSAPLFDSVPRLQNFSPVWTAETPGDQSRGQSPLGFTQDDPILIDSQGYDGDTAGSMVDNHAPLDRLGTDNLSVESEKAEVPAVTIKADKHDITTEPTTETLIQGDEALAWRLQAQENMKDYKNVKKGKEGTILKCTTSAECGQCESCERKQKDVKTILNNCRTSHDWRDLKSSCCALDKAVAGTTTGHLSSPANSQNKPQSGTSQSPARKHPAQSFEETLSFPQPVKKFKTQVESDEELARRLQRELDGEGTDDPVDLQVLVSQEDDQTDSGVLDVDAWSGSESAQEVLWPENREDETVALRLQQEEMLGCAKYSSECAQSGDVSYDLTGDYFDHNSVMLDEALARKLQEKEELHITSPQLHMHTSTPLSKKNRKPIRNIKQECFDDVQKSSKLEISYIESDEELARRLQEQEEKEVVRSRTWDLSLEQTCRSTVKVNKADGSVDVTLVEDEHLTHKLQKEQKTEAPGHAGRERRVGRQCQEQKDNTMMCGAASVSDTPEAKTLPNLKEESKLCVSVEGSTDSGTHVKGSAVHGTCSSHGTYSAHDIKWSSTSDHQNSSAFSENVAVHTTESASATVSSNVKCGSCGQKGHNRRFDRCPNYYTEKEKKRRDAMEEAHRRRVEERAREAEERQREEQRALQRLTVTREVLQHNKEQMMQQIAAATQQCASQFQSQLDDIDRLIDSKQRKLKTKPKKQ